MTETMEPVDILGFRISSGGLESDVDSALHAISLAKKGCYMACANPHSLVLARRDYLFRIALQEANILVPDGAGIILAAKILNLPLKERVAGPEFFHDLTQRLAKKGGSRYFFLGSTDHVLNLIAQRLNSEFPEITVCGTLSPPFKPVFSPEENAAIVSAINAANPDVLWVGMTAPKQEKWIYQNRGHLKVTFIGAIGAVFDFYAGTKKRSSTFWQRLGLEWLPRFLNEPARLWERNLKSAPIFVGWVLKEKIRQMVG